MTARTRRRLRVLAEDVLATQIGSRAVVIRHRGRGTPGSTTPNR
jgi:hypothetical protein